jgi:hypothetical protein
LSFRTPRRPATLDRAPTGYRGDERALPLLAEGEPVDPRL